MSKNHQPQTQTRPFSNKIQNALEAMEAKYRSMFENAVSGIFQTTADGKYISANPALARLYGYKSTEEMMQALTNIQQQLYVESKRRDEFISVLQEHDSVSEFESQVYRRDGQIIWISESARAVRDAQGNLLYYEGFVEDITQRKQAEKALKESEERLRLVIEGVKDYAIFMLDTNGYIVSWNSGAENILGYLAETIIGQNFDKFFIPEDLKNSKHTQELALAAALGRFEEEGWRLRQDGTKFWANSIVTALYDEKSGKLRGFSKVIRDITERQQSLAIQSRLIASLQESEKKFRSLYESTTDAVILLDENGFIDCNRATLELFNCPNKAKFIELSVADLSPPFQPNEKESRPLAQEYIRTAMFTGSYRFDWWHRRLDGSDFPAEVLLTAMDIGGKQGLQAVIRDITDRVRAQENLKRLNEELEYRVRQRTAELQQVVKRLQAEIGERQRAEEQLKMSEEKFSKAFLSSPDPLVISTLEEGRFIEVNHSFLSITGYSLDEVINNTAFDLQLWSNPQERSEMIEMLEKQGAVRNKEYEFRIKAGKIAVFLVSIELIELGGQSCLLSVMTDITERKRAEEALRESQRALSTLMGNLPGMAYRLGGNNTRFLEFVSEGCYQLTGYHPEEFCQEPKISLGEITHPEDQEDLSMIVLSALQEKRPYQLTYRLITKSGRIKWVWEQGIGIFSETGELTALEGLITDITERKEAEDALRKSQVELSQQKTQLEQTLQELQQTQSTLIHSEKMSSLGQMMAGVAHEVNNPVTSVCGNLVHLSHYTKDLMQLVNLYQENYPSPVPAIQAEMEDMELDFLMEDLPKVITAMQLGADRIREIVRSLRNFSRTDDERIGLVDLHEGLEGTLLILHNRMKARDNYPEIQVIKEYGNLPQVECYPGKINQVFMNLIGNAIDALEEYNDTRTPEEIRKNPNIIRVSTTLENNQAVIKIKDSGAGMTEEVKERLFSSFFTTKPVGKGTGLGLSISYQIIVDKHRGQLICNSSPGTGAEFVIHIPLKHPIKTDLA